MNEDKKQLRELLVQIKGIVVAKDPDDNDLELRKIWEKATLALEIIDIPYPPKSV